MARNPNRLPGRELERFDRILLPQVNSPITPALAFGDGDTGIYEESDDVLAITLGGVRRFKFESTRFITGLSGGGGLLNETSSGTNPTLIPSRNDEDTGLGHAAADTLSLIAGGVEGQRITEVGGLITHELTGNVQGAVMNNLNAFDFGERVLNIMTSPVLLNVMCEDPGAGTLYDISGNGHDGTYTGTWVTAQRLKQGRTWKVSPNGTDNYINFGDHNDFSFGDGTNDSVFTFLGLIEVTGISGAQVIISKYDETSGSELREFRAYLENDETLRIAIFDESANVDSNCRTNAALSLGIHSFCIVYDGSGGATAGDGISIYVDGALVASTAGNNGAYVAMENLATALWIFGNEGSGGTPSLLCNGDIGVIGIDAAEWSAEDAHRFHQLCLANYSEDGSGL